MSEQKVSRYCKHLNVPIKCVTCAIEAQTEALNKMLVQMTDILLEGFAEQHGKTPKEKPDRLIKKVTKRVRK